VLSAIKQLHRFMLCNMMCYGALKGNIDGGHKSKDRQYNDQKIGTNCAPLLADLFLHAYEAYFLQGILKNKDGRLA